MARQGLTAEGLTRSLAGFGVLLALTAVSLFALSLVGPGPGVAASAPRPLPPTEGKMTIETTNAPTTTVFLPFVVHQTVMPNVWLGEYFTNADLLGSPAYSKQEARIDHGWGDGAPDGLPNDNFSVRWTGDWGFEVGEYTFFVFADNGARLWLDDELLIDAWTLDDLWYQKTLLVETEGFHKLKLEYREITGGASISLSWRRTDLYPQWLGEYFTQPWVESGKVYERTDVAIQLEWGSGCPTGLPCDGFSIRWQATPVFEAGTHRIYIYADDGYQLFVDSNKVKEAGWYEGQGGGHEDDSYDLEVSGLQQHQITYNFHDRGSLAEARLWIETLEQPSWTAQYYNNKTLSGTPVVTKTDPAIFHDWKWDSPRGKVNGDHFSVRWRGQRYFHAGSYRFGCFVDDGVRVWVDGELLIDHWYDGRNLYYAPITYLSTGYHEVVVEYYENTGEAEIRFWFE